MDIEDLQNMDIRTIQKVKQTLSKSRQMENKNLDLTWSIHTSDDYKQLLLHWFYYVVGQVSSALIHSDILLWFFAWVRSMPVGVSAYFYGSAFLR